MKSRKLILIHGLNNNSAAFWSLDRALEENFRVFHLRLPQHGPEAAKFDFNRYIGQFRDELESYISEDTYILAYSLGAAYLQYLIETEHLNISLKKIIFLSPALKTKYSLKIFKFMPSYFPIPSFSPRDFRQRNYSNCGQYHMLHLLTESLTLREYPTIFADPSDELIDLQGLKYISINRDELPYGEHHISFHPKYFSKDLWEKLMKEIVARFQNET